MSLGVLDGDGRAEGIAFPDEDSELELVVQASARGEFGFGATGRQDLSPRPADLLPGQADRGAAPVIADGQPFVVGEQRIVGPEQAAHGGRMMNGGVEIGEIADDRGKRVFHPRLEDEAALKGRPSIRSLPQAVEYRVAKRAPGGGTELHQTVQHRVGGAQDRGAGVGVPSPSLARSEGADPAPGPRSRYRRGTAHRRLVGEIRRTANFEWENRSAGGCAAPTQLFTCGSLVLSSGIAVGAQGRVGSKCFFNPRQQPA